MFNNNRFKSLRIERNLSQKTLAKIFNLSDATINRYEKGTRQPDTNFISKVAKFFNVSTDYLLGNTDIRNSQNTNINVTNDCLLKLPIIETITSTTSIYSEKNIIGFEEIATNGLPDGELFFFKVFGDSMNLSRITDGDIILVKRQEEVENGDIAVVLVNRSNATVKKFYNNNNGTVTLMSHSSNPIHLPKIINVKDEPVYVIGKVIKNVINF